MLKIKKRFPIGKLVIVGMSIVTISACAAAGAMNAHYTDKITDNRVPHSGFQQSDTASAVSEQQGERQNNPASSEPKTTETNQTATNVVTSAKLDNHTPSIQGNSVTSEVIAKAPTNPTVVTDPISNSAVSSQTTAEASSPAADTPSIATEETAVSTPAETGSQTATSSSQQETATAEASKAVRKPCRGLSLLGLCISLF